MNEIVCDEYFEIGDAVVFVKYLDSSWVVTVFPEKDKDDAFTLNIDCKVLRSILDSIIDYFGGWSFVDSMLK